MLPAPPGWPSRPLRALIVPVKAPVPAWRAILPPPPTPVLDAPSAPSARTVPLPDRCRSPTRCCLPPRRVSPQAIGGDQAVQHRSARYGYPQLRHPCRCGSCLRCQAQLGAQSRHAFPPAGQLDRTGPALPCRRDCPRLRPSPPSLPRRLPSLIHRIARTGNIDCARGIQRERTRSAQTQPRLQPGSARVPRYLSGKDSAAAPASRG